MFSKKSSLVALILFCVASVSNAQERNYYLISNQQVSATLKNTNIKFFGAYNSDSSYIGVNIRLNISKIEGSSALMPAQKIDWRWTNINDTQLLIVSYFEPQNLSTLLGFIKAKNISSYYLRPTLKSVFIKTTKSLVLELAALNDVKSVAFLHPSVQAFNFVERTGHRVNFFNSRFPFSDSNSLTGNGIRLGEWDGGAVGNHIDFRNRLSIIKAPNISNHATHVAGTMAGAGNLIENERGMAPNAKIYSWDFNGDIPLEMDTSKPKYDFHLTQNSYGYWGNTCNTFANYDQTSTEMDALSIKHNALLHVFAAGNSRAMNCIAGGYGTILSGFQTAKNTISVAAITHLNAEANFSSAGPTLDGRLKPEISAIGVNVLSTLNGNSYGFSSGTSMATPGASGTIALLLEKFIAKNNYTPLNYLTKNIIANSADDIGNAGPDFKHGFGKINLINAVKIVENDAWKIDSVGSNQQFTDSFYVPGFLHEFKTMLTWNDPEVFSTNNANILVNDLDLRIIKGSTTHLPWVLNPTNPSALAVRKRDSLNNIEQITLTNPDSGWYKINVLGKVVPNGKQVFALSYLTHKKELLLEYPNGFETMEPPSTAAKSQLIRWNAKGVSGTFSVMFSRDSGYTWSTLVSGLSNTTKNYIWQNASDTINTGKAMIKVVSSSGVEDQSDGVFSISKNTLVPQITSCSNQVFIRWNRPANAISFKIFQLIDGSMKTVGTTNDTSFLVANLNNKQAHYFSLAVQFKNGAKSGRLNAFLVNIDSTKKAPQVLVQPKDMKTCNNQLYFAKSTVNGSATIVKNWEYSTNNGNTWQSISSNSDSIDLKPFISQSMFLVRRTYTNVCLALVYTRSALFEIDSAIQLSLINIDSSVCRTSVLFDSVKLFSQTPAKIIWFSDSVSKTDTLQIGFSNKISFNANHSQSIWVSATNYCGEVRSKNLNFNPKIDGKNTYTLYNKPQIIIADTIWACMGEKITIQPTILDGKPMQNNIFFKTIDSFKMGNSFDIEIKKNTVVEIGVFDNCEPDTSLKNVIVMVRQPLQVSINSDTTICFNGLSLFNAKAKGGNGNYQYKWSDSGILGASRSLKNLKQTTKIKLELKDNCTTLSAFDSITVNVLQPLSFQTSKNQDTFCYGTELTTLLSPKGGKPNAYQITWNDAEMIGFNAKKTAIQSQRLIATLSDACSPDFKDSFDIYVWEKPSVSIAKIDTVCNAKIVTLSASFNGGKPGFGKVRWLANNSVSPTINLTPSFSQTVIAQFEDGCSLPLVFDTTQLNVYDALALKKISDTTICYGQSLLLKSQGFGGKTNTLKHYWGQQKSTTTLADSFNTKTYNYSVSDACGDSIFNSFKVAVSPKLDIQPLFLKKCSYNNLPFTFTINTQKPNTIVWDKLPNGPQQIFKNKTSEKYLAILNDACSDTSHVEITVSVSDFSKNNFSLNKISNKNIAIQLPKINEYKNTVIWNANNQENVADSFASFNFPNYGKYNICRILTDEINCTDTICKTIDNSDPKGFSNFEIKIFPNPFQNSLKIQINQFCESLKLEVFNDIGQLIIGQQIVYPKEKMFEIDASALSSGVYFVKLNINGEEFIKKVVKI